MKVNKTITVLLVMVILISPLNARIYCAPEDPQAQEVG